MNRLPFLDWMKAIGMLLIVYGHSAAGTHFFTTDPIYVKQLGVAFFVFVTGYGLAREGRSTGYVVFSRIFPICLYGFGFAVFMSIIGLAVRGDPAESNYLPFLFGANVLVNAFPANPTTWYIGTYIHIIFFWAICLRKVPVRWPLLLAWLPLSVAIRAALIAGPGQYVAYMLISNWMTLFLLGMLSADSSTRTAPDKTFPWHRIATVTALGVCLCLGWPLLVQAASFDSGFPFRVVQLDGPFVSLLGTSVLAELMYVLGTVFVFQLTLLLPHLRLVQFFARNTLVIFIFHMPLVKLLHPYVGHLDSGYARVLVNILIYYVLLAIVGELLRKAVRQKELQAAILNRFRELRGAALTHDCR